MSLPQNRRRVLSTLALAGAAGLIRAPLVLASEASLEITTVRLQRPGLCVAALDIAEALLRADGFTDIRYVDAIAATAPVSLRAATSSCSCSRLRHASGVSGAKSPGS